MLEREIEKYLCARVAALGGIAEKTTSPGGRGYFDRVVVLPGGRIIFCEVKKPRGSVMPRHQRMRQDAYRRLGAEAVVLKTIADVDRLLGQACPDGRAGVPKERAGS